LNQSPGNILETGAAKSRKRFEPCEEQIEAALRIRLASNPRKKLGIDACLDLGLVLCELGESAVVRESPSAENEGVGIAKMNRPHRCQPNVRQHRLGRNEVADALEFRIAVGGTDSVRYFGR